MHIDFDVPITMSDGVVLKANVYRPADRTGRPIASKTPTLVNLTPYTKLISWLLDEGQSVPGLQPAINQLVTRFGKLDGTPLSGVGDQVRTLAGGATRSVTVDRKMIQDGYSQIVVDVRGTGFSQGKWGVFNQREQQDSVEVINWAAKQSWSTGDIGMSGASYSGINQLQAAEKHPQALKAIFPVVAGSDLVRDVAAPGGALGAGFIPAWLTGVNTLKLLPNLKSIADGRFDWKWLASRVQDPFTFFDTLIAALTVPTVESAKSNPLINDFLNENSTLRKAWVSNPGQISIPTFVVGGWHDLFTFSEARNFAAINTPPAQKKLLMGDWYHGTVGSSLGERGSPPRLDVLQKAWFDRWLKHQHNGIDEYPTTTLYQQGNGWTFADQFPRSASEYRRSYLTPARSGTAPHSVFDGTLASRPSPKSAVVTVAPNLSTLCSRDGAEGTAGILGIVDGCGKDSRIAERGGLTFSTRPARQNTSVSGPINVHLNTTLDSTDGLWVTTINDVAPDGKSTVIGTAQITASLRAIDPARSQRSPNGDYALAYPSLSLATRQPVRPGEPTQVDLSIPPTDAMIRAGHRLRLDIFALDLPKTLLLRPLLNESQLRPQHIILSDTQPSFINVPSDLAFN